jgi:hypothetical protein
MLTLVLEVPIGDNHRRVGPEPFFRLEGETLKTPAGEHVAVHRGGLWVIGNAAYIALYFDTSVSLSFDDPNTGGKAQLGPYPRMRIVNGSIWVTKDDHIELLANFNDMTGLWTVYPAVPLKAANLTIRPGT